MTEQDPLQRLADAAHRQLPPPDDGSFARMTEHVVMAGRARARRRRSQRTLMGMAAVAAALILLVLASERIGAPEAPLAPLTVTEVELPTGDRIEQAAHARLAIDAVASEGRAVRLSEGDTLFDVAPLGPEGHFSVHTPRARIEVIGTVFAVSVSSDRTRVEVYEGVVSVVRPGAAPVRVESGDRYDSAGPVGDWTSPLAERGRRAARRRDRRRLAETARATVAAPPTEAQRVTNDARPSPVSDVAPVTSADAADPLGERASAPSATRDALVAEPRPVDPSPRARPAGIEPDEAASPAPPTKAQIQAWLASGESALALAGARRGVAASPDDAEWALLLADALRAVRDPQAAVAAYVRAAELSSPSRAAHAGYMAAYIELHDRGDATSALRTLARWRSAAPGSPLEERALELTVRAHLALDDRASARSLAHVYLTRFPSGTARSWMERVVDDSGQ